MGNLKKLHLFTVLALFVLMLGCAGTKKMVDRALPGPQVVVNPQVIPLGVATLVGTDFVFDGSGFTPGDTVFISLIGKPDVDIALALTKVNKDGTFQAEMGQSSPAKIAKIVGILRGNVSSNENLEPVIVLTKPTIPAGAYTIRASSLMTQRKAETPVTVAEPSILNRIMDGIGGMLGSIVDKR